MIWGDLLLRNIPTVFVLEMMVALVMFTRRFQRRKHFKLRVAAGIAGSLTASFLIPTVLWAVANQRSFEMIVVLFLLLLVVMVCAVQLCFRCTPYDAIFCGIAAYAVQNGIYQTVEILQLAAKMTGVDFSGNRPAAWVILAIVHLVAYWGVYVLLAKDGAKEHYPVRKGELMGLSGITLVIVLRVLPDAQNVTAAHETAWLFLHVLCCGLSLYILFGMSENEHLRKELDVMQQMWHMKADYYELSREVTESINLKCHNLKYQLASLRHSSGSELDKQALREIENAVMIYDSIAKTGNEALDTILTEKMLLCEKNGIKLTYIVDGEKLDFIKPIDIYVIFGNALDNAIESVMKLQEDAQRIISLNISVRGKLLIANLKNSYCGELTIENGLPVTSKDNTTSHGFGLKSIRLLAQKYGGEMTFSAQDGIFSLNILLPME